MQSLISLNLKKSFYFFLSLRAGGILQILQSDWFRERAVFYDLARLGALFTSLFAVCE